MLQPCALTTTDLKVAFKHWKLSALGSQIGLKLNSRGKKG